MKRILSMLLAVVMIAGTVGTMPVNAEEPGIPEETVTLMEEMSSDEVSSEESVTESTPESPAEDDESEEVVSSTDGNEQENTETEDTASDPESSVVTEAESGSEISETAESASEEESIEEIITDEELSTEVIEEVTDPKEIPMVSYKPEGEGDPIFKTFTVGIDTSNKYTSEYDLNSDGKPDGYYIGMDSRDVIQCDYELSDGISDSEINYCQVTFTSELGTMNFGLNYPMSWSSATSSYTTSFSKWMNEGVQVVRHGAGYDTIIVEVRVPGSGVVVAEGIIKILQYGWESYIGATYSHAEYSGRYFEQNGRPLTGWQKFRYDGDSDCEVYVHDGAGGDLDIYFDPETGVAASGIYEIEGKKYYFEQVQNDVVYQPYVLKKADEDMSFVGLGSYSICLNRDGSLTTGIVNKGSDRYYFDPETGRQVRGEWVQTEEGLRYAQVDGKLIGNGKIEHAQGGVYILKDGEILKGWCEDSEGHKYYSDPVSGDITYGIIKIKSKKYLQTEEGIPQEAGMHHCTAIDNSLYTNAQGIIEGGKEVTLKMYGEDKIFYINPDGTMYFGFKKVGKKTYEYTQMGREEVAEVEILNYEDYEPGGYGYLDNKGNLVFYKDTNKQEKIKDKIVVLKIDGYPVVIINKNGMISYGWYTIDGKKYYTDKLTGRLYNTTRAGKLYDIEGKLYYLGKDSYVTCPENPWITYNGARYYIGSDGRPVTGWKTIKDEENSDQVFYFEKTGELNTTGLIGGKYYLLKENYSVVKPVQAGIFDYKYCLNADGSIKTGWASVKVKEAGTTITKRYYTPKSNPKNGFLHTPNILYRIGGKYYAFDSHGAMRTGWQQGFQFYNDAETQEERHFPVISEYMFYFDPKTGVMAVGKKSIISPISGKKEAFYFGTDFSENSYLGAMIEGGIIRSGSRLITIKNGQEVSLKDHANGIHDGSYYISKGKLASGFKTDNGKKYYFDPATGLMVKNELRKISGKWYYFNPDGVMSSNLRGYIIDSDGTPVDEIISVNHGNGYIKYFICGDTKKTDIRVRILGSTYILNDKGALVTGAYTMKKGEEKGRSYLAGADGRLITKSHNTLVKYGNKHYLVNNDGLLLTNGKYNAGSGWKEAFTQAEIAQIYWTSLDDWEADKCSFYTDAKGAVIKNKVITDDAGNRICINKYGLKGGPFYKQSGKWYWYGESGAKAPGRYRVEVEYASSGATDIAYITVGKKGQITGGAKRSDGSAVQGFVLIRGTDMAGYYYLDKKGIPSTGSKKTVDGSLNFNSVTGIADIRD